MDALLTHAFRGTTTDSFMGLRLGMSAVQVKTAIGAGSMLRDGDLSWEREAPCMLGERIQASFRPDGRDDLIGASLLYFSRDPQAAKSVRALAKALREELGRRFEPIEDKSTFRFVVDGRVNRLWIGTGAIKDPEPFAYAKITLSDPTY